MKFKPLADRVLIEVLEAEEQTKSGIVLPDTAKEKPQQGKVLAVGEGKSLENGEVKKLSVKKGNVVVFSKYAGTEVRDDEGKEYLILREDDILAIVES